MQELEHLKEEIKFLESEKKRLSELIGVWRRKAQEKAPRMAQEVVSASYSERDKVHYVAYRAPDIPADLPFKEALREVAEVFMPTVTPYKFSRLALSTHYESWTVTVEAPLNVDMSNRFNNLDEEKTHFDS
ncbi:hypothetical protein [Sporosarcina sp. SG10008]|uniref:hypothetical protein n=1 Tax=Sporosarcina sp. SG10008 TaxID=3373103 RepID=UPI0037DC71C4